MKRHPCPPFGCESGKTHSLKGGPDYLVSGSQPVWAGQLAALLVALADEWRLFFEFLVKTGCRIGEPSRF
ncbi:MAG: hypothetical protein ACRDQT_06230, partial [Gaiellaceae bacterium]